MLREIFLVREGGVWRPPVVNETCCRRPALADFLEDGENISPRTARGAETADVAW